MPHEFEQRNVIAGIRVCPARGKISAESIGECPGRIRLSWTVENVADEASGERAIDDLDLGAESPREPEAAGDDPRDRRWRRGDEPDLVALGEVVVGEGHRLRPELGADVAVVDLVREFDEILLRMAARELERALAHALEVTQILPDRNEAQLLPAEHEQVADGEHPASEGPPPEMVDARPAQESVVDVEECDHAVVGCRWDRSHSDHGSCENYARCVPTVQLTIIGKPECHLCDVAAGVIDEVVTDLGPEVAVEVEKLSILDDSSLHEKYWEKIPVILVNGTEHAHWHVDPAGLRAAILAV